MDANDLDHADMGAAGCLATPCRSSKLFECHSCGLLRQPTIGPHSLTRSRPKSPRAHKSQQSEWKGSRQEAPYAVGGLKNAIRKV